FYGKRLAMCGIVGIARHSGQSLVLSFEDRDSALASIRHRGPDSEGQYADNRVWLGHLRLKILDLSEAGNQPMSSPDGRFVLCYNGEVYNFAELARELDLQDLRSHSDTEVVLRAFMKKGVASIKMLNGMFAFAIYDREAKKIWLVRDRLGIKPLYYRVSPQGLFFASEIKALLALNGHESKCDLTALHEWLYYGTTLGEHTLFNGIQKLLPGHYLELDLDSLQPTIECYWSPTEYAGCEKFNGSVDEQVKQTRDLLAQAVERQLVSDVPVGVFLSGGIDSSAITAFAARHYGSKLSTYSVGFDFDKGVNELPKAKAIAELYGTEHHELHISGFEIPDVVQKMVESHDMPFSDAANIPLYLLSSKVNDRAKVILQGDGGDEMFGGYSRYTTLSFSKMARLLARLGGVVNRLAPRNAHYYRRQRYINALTPAEPADTMALLLTEEDGRSSPADIFTREFRSRIMTSDRFARYKECQSYFRDEDPVNQMLLVDAMIILPDIFLEKVDRSTMAASVEVRVPFLDNDLVDFCMRLSGPQKVRFGQKKWLLKKALSGVVPDSVLYGKKTGFGVPYGYWLRGALKPLFFDQFEMFEKSHPAVLDRKVIEDLYQEHESRRRDRSFLLWKILNFMIWANQTSISLN
ncbi:MAG TPA: asparagine synthase (glutamine-hydrolyzing), partial [Pyrinomonadaceae bacterium]|nr:asparagine synthase (glutamine-hydrolyzing) [Pyrinomonadaceae bacterium]